MTDAIIDSLRDITDPVDLKFIINIANQCLEKLEKLEIQQKADRILKVIKEKGYHLDLDYFNISNILSLRLKYKVRLETDGGSNPKIKIDLDNKEEWIQLLKCETAFIGDAIDSNSGDEATNKYRRQIINSMSPWKMGNYALTAESYLYVFIYYPKIQSLPTNNISFNIICNREYGYDVSLDCRVYKWKMADGICYDENGNVIGGVGEEDVFIVPIN